MNSSGINSGMSALSAVAKSCKKSGKIDQFFPRNPLILSQRFLFTIDPLWFKVGRSYARMRRRQNQKERNMKDTAKVRGRPKLPAAQARGIFEKLRVNRAERKAIHTAAKRAGVDRSEWMRQTLLEAAQTT
jgi:hypothetical protein